MRMYRVCVMRTRSARLVIAGIRERCEQRNADSETLLPYNRPALLRIVFVVDMRESSERRKVGSC